MTLSKFDQEGIDYLEGQIRKIQHVTGPERDDSEMVRPLIGDAKFQAVCIWKSQIKKYEKQIQDIRAGRA